MYSPAAAAMIRGPPHRVSKILAASLRTSLKRALDKNRVEEVKALLEQGAEVQPALLTFLPGVPYEGSWIRYAVLNTATNDHMLSVIVDGGWCHEHIAQCIATLEQYTAKMSAEIESYRSTTENLRRWNERFIYSRTEITNREAHDLVVSRLWTVMKRAQPAEAEERSRAASGVGVGVVPPGIGNASEVLDTRGARIRQLSSGVDAEDDDASFLVGYMVGRCKLTPSVRS